MNRSSWGGPLCYPYLSVVASKYLGQSTTHPTLTLCICSMIQLGVFWKLWRVSGLGRHVAPCLLPLHHDRHGLGYSLFMIDSVGGIVYSTVIACYLDFDWYMGVAVEEIISTLLAYQDHPIDLNRNFPNPGSIIPNTLDGPPHQLSKAPADLVKEIIYFLVLMILGWYH